ncbi:MAG: ribosome silencing factor [Magnetococcus sp. DMHC-1]|nr:ribosome silencing factor [Magnetococcales bacterium]
MDSPDMAATLEHLLDEKKAQEITRIDLRGRSPFTDFFLIATGTSETHVRSMAMEVDRFASQAKIQGLGMAGMEAGQWVLIDLGDVVIHLFQRETRAFYNLEKLWSPESLAIDDQLANALPDQDGPRKASFQERLTSFQGGAA